MEQSDAELIAGARDGDRESYSELYRRYSASGLRFATSLTGDPARAADLVSEAFIKIMSLLDDGRGPDSNFNSYLLTTIRNVMIDDLRRHRREELVEDVTTHKAGDDATDDHAEAQAEATVVNRAFASLPQRWRDVLWYTEVLDEPLETVATRFGIKRNAVGVLSWRAREGFRQAYLAEHLAAATDPECRKYAPQIPQYVREQLTASRVDDLERHLSSCAVCPVAVVDLAGINTNLGALVAPAVLFVAVGGAHRRGGMLSGLLHSAASKVAAGAVLAAASVVAAVAMHPSSATYAQTSTATAPPVPSTPAVVVPPSSAPRTTKPRTRPTAPEPVVASGLTTVAASHVTKPRPRPVHSPLSLDQPDVSTVSAGQTKDARIVAVVGPADRSLSLTIDVTNATGFRLSSAEWQCRVRTTSANSVSAVCRTSSIRSAAVPVQFDVSIPDTGVPMTGTITARDGRAAVSRKFLVSP